MNPDTRVRVVGPTGGTVLRRRPKKVAGSIPPSAWIGQTGRVVRTEPDGTVVVELDKQLGRPRGFRPEHLQPE